MTTLARWVAAGAAMLAASASWSAEPAPALRKVRDFVLYEDARFYAAFPSVVRRPDGELIVAFRRAPACRRQASGGHSRA